MLGVFFYLTAVLASCVEGLLIYTPSKQLSACIIEKISEYSNMKRMTAVVGALFLALVSMTSHAQTYAIGTGSQSGIYYPFGGRLLAFGRKISTTLI